MKKLLCLALAVVMLLSLTACGDKPAKTPDEGSTEATTTEATTTEATTTTEETTTEATTTEPEPEPLVYVESLFTKIPVTKENKVDVALAEGATETEDEIIVWDEDGEGVLITSANLITFALPYDVPVDTTVVIHAKGTSDDNFRAWLMDSALVTSSNQINMLNDMKYFANGDFDFLLELTCQYFDAEIADNIAKKICFKASSWNTALTNLKIDELAIFNGNLEEYRTACENPEAYTPEQPAEEVTTAPVDNTEVESTTTEAQWSIEPANETRYATADLNVRATPEQDGERISHVDEGDEVTVTGWVDNGWARIKFRDGEYFVNGKYLSEDKPVVTTATTAEATTATTKEEKPTEYKYIIYSSNGSDKGDGSAKNPYKTYEQAKAHKAASNEIPVILEYYMTVTAKTVKSSTMKGLDGLDVTLTEFSAKATGGMTGNTVYNGSYLEKTEDGKTFYSARYMLSGKDASNANAKIYIEDSGYALDCMTPFVVSEGGSVASWQNKSLRSVYTETKDGFTVDYYRLVSDDGRKTSVPRDPDDYGTYTYVFFSPKTGNDNNDGSQYAPVKTKEKAEEIAKRKSVNGKLQILEYIMTVDVATVNGGGVGGINAIPFYGDANGAYFNGTMPVIGCDTQKWGFANTTPFSARYMLEGKDADGKSCHIYIENSGSGLDKCLPRVSSDSKLIHSLVDRELRTIVVPGGRGVAVWLYAVVN